MKTICIFCGASTGNNPIYEEEALKLTDAMVKQRFTLLYGGGNLGLMGAIANRALALGGKVIGVIPEILAQKEQAHTSLTEMHRVKGMLERKKQLIDDADAFIALPGGLGTLDELFEVMVLNQIGYHRKPVAMLNTAGYYDHLQAFLNHAHNEAFVRGSNAETLIVETTPERLLDQLKSRQL